MSQRKRILLMDDDESFCEVMKNILTELGYSTTFVNDGKKALQEYKRAKEDNNQYTIVILDLSVKYGMDGEEASQLLLKYDPHVIIIISSGYSNREIISNYREHGIKEILLKPYNLTQLKKILEKYF